MPFNIAIKTTEKNKVPKVPDFFKGVLAAKYTIYTVDSIGEIS